MNQILIFAIVGAVIGGIYGGIAAVKKKKNIWTGKPVAKGRSIYSFRNTPKQ